MVKIKVAEKDLLRAIGEGLTHTEIGERFGLTAGVAASISRDLYRRHNKGPALLMLEWIDDNIDPEGPEAADTWEAVVDNMLPRTRTLLGELVRAVRTSACIDLSDVRTSLITRLSELEEQFAGKPSPPPLVVLRNVLRDTGGLAFEINVAAEAVGLPPQPDQTWIKLVRLSALASAFEFMATIRPVPEEGA